MHSNSELTSKFFDCIKYGDIENLQKLQQTSNIDLESYTEGFETHTPLLYAIEKNRKEIVNHLLQNGANSNHRPFCNTWSPLHMASTSSNTEIVDLLMVFGADVNVRGKNDMTPLHLAASFERADIVTRLVQNGAKVNDEDEEGRTALTYAAEKDNEDIARFLLQHHAKIDPPRFHTTPLHFAIKNQNILIVEMFLSQSADVNFQVPLDNGCLSKTALMYAIETGNVHMLCLLLEKGADVNMVGLDDENSGFDRLPLEYSVSLDQKTCTNILITHLLKLKYLKHRINEENLEFLDQNLESRRTNWRKEVEELKNDKLCCGTELSVIDLLVESHVKIVSFLSGDAVKKAVKMFDARAKYPVYGDLLNYRAKSALEAAEKIVLRRSFVKVRNSFAALIGKRKNKQKNDN